MQINIEIEDTLLADIDKAVGILKISRTEAFMEALKSWVIHQPKLSAQDFDWSTFEGDPNFPPFESYRDEFIPYRFIPPDKNV